MAYELRCVLRAWLPGGVVMTEALALVSKLEDAANEVLREEVRRLGT